MQAPSPCGAGRVGLVRLMGQTIEFNKNTNLLMQIKIFSINMDALTEETEALNKFLRGHRILSVQQELVQQVNSISWCFCIRYLEDSELKSNWKVNKKDYKEILEPDAFTRFTALRDVRKTIAQEEAVPAYVIFTDDELAQFAKLPKITQTAMLGVQGVGKQKLEKYGIQLLNKYDAALGESNFIDS
jgi:superfamily II DNA helicase RecQ